jgi:glutaryl-CoA dehydrogenase
MKKEIHGLIVERGMEGFTTPETHNKWSLRIINWRINF